MRSISTILAMFISVSALAPQVASSQVRHTSIPAAAFQGKGSSQNVTGTARFLRTLLYAPVNLPQGATVLSLTCGGKAAFNKQIVFTLRRNDPQQANLDMATAETTLAGTSFQTVSAVAIPTGVINNSRFNYYLIAEADKVGGNQPGNGTVCKRTRNGIDPRSTECSVGFCRIRHTSGL